MSTTLGILGGGQLAMLMCHSAQELGIDTAVLSADPNAPARSACTHFVQGSFGDNASLNRLAELSQVVTLDTEHVPDATLVYLAQRTEVQPGPELMRQLSDRLTQRAFLRRVGAPQPEFWSIDSRSALEQAQAEAQFPAVLKLRKGGYDGKGQRKVRCAEELVEAWDELGQMPCVMERWIIDVQEFSVVGARGSEGQMRLYPPIDNVHIAGQLHISRWPAPISAAARERGEEIWRRIASQWDGRGVIAVEFFLAPDGQVLVNEIAPRVHNSGHLTSRGANCSQFELHVRATMELPLPQLDVRDCGMLNLYPEHGINDPATAQAMQARYGGEIILYGKAPRRARKMGHWLLDVADIDAARQILLDQAQAAPEEFRR
nr:5-(carboxyamino)imidazole ribonucleotide synthase [Oceanococcus sp. HetDA_MAG_MS8]